LQGCCNIIYTKSVAVHVNRFQLLLRLVDCDYYYYYNWPLFNRSICRKFHQFRPGLIGFLRRNKPHPLYVTQPKVSKHSRSKGLHVGQTTSATNSYRKPEKKPVLDQLRRRHWNNERDNMKKRL